MSSASAPRRPRTEREVRVDLAAAYRLAALAGWDDTVYTHLSARVPGRSGVYLINEFGLGFDEVCASNLVPLPSAAASGVTSQRRAAMPSRPP